LHLRTAILGGASRIGLALLLFDALQNSKYIYTKQLVSFSPVGKRQNEPNEMNKGSIIRH